MSMKTILVPMEKHDGMQSVLETALLLARGYDSYIEGFSLRWTPVDFAVGDTVAAFPVEPYKREMAAQAQRARQTFETFMQKSGVPRSTERTTSLSFGWLNAPLEGETFVGNYGRAFDVIVMNRPDVNSSPQSIANVGIGHNAIDGGGAYTYFDQKAGHEFSATLGFTYNFENTHTNYQNGVDMHVDWGASQFLTKQWQVGLVGYWYQQLSCDSGSGDRVGCFKSRVVGIGPQIGYIFPLSKEWQGYVNLKGYGEFAAEHRPDGWNAWLTFVISPAAPGEAPPSARRMITK